MADLGLSFDQISSFLSPYIESGKKFLEESVICLSVGEKYFLLGLLSERNVTTKLLYRGTRDGFECKDFHQRCDMKGATITLFKNEADRRFGGFTT